MVARLVDPASFDELKRCLEADPRLTVDVKRERAVYEALNWQSFAELAFRFTLTPKIVLQSLAFALLMAFAGGVLPAFRAARLKIVDALRAA